MPLIGLFIHWISEYLCFRLGSCRPFFLKGILQLKSVLISFHINTFHFSLHINELNMVENSSQESTPVPTSILILAGRGSLRRCLGSFGSSRIYFRLITSGSVNKGESVLIDTSGSVNSHSPFLHHLVEGLRAPPGALWHGYLNLSLRLYTALGSCLPVVYSF